MAERFMFPLRGDAKEMLERVKREAGKQGINFDGNTRSGSFSKRVIIIVLKGSYVVRGQEVHVRFDVTPPGYNRTRIEQEARKLFG